ncbi:hypothetical protein C8Q74DRAFT_1299111 [Fomes fomentarius]|nr:hypothetical protein C8Q74DRAFT_1299111 [Fomes fomentarius]
MGALQLHLHTLVALVMGTCPRWVGSHNYYCTSRSSRPVHMRRRARSRVRTTNALCSVNSAVGAFVPYNATVLQIRIRACTARGHLLSPRPALCVHVVL